MNRPATTVIELLLVITLLGILFTLGMPQARKGLDGIAVRSARESAFGVAMRARSLAIARGGADLVFDLTTRTATAQDAAGGVDAQALLAAYDVVLASDGSPTNRVVLHYDMHGIGRMASRTIRFRRGTAESGLTFSSFGRVRRW